MEKIHADNYGVFRQGVKLRKVAYEHSKVYLTLAALLAALGFAYLIFFPVFTLIGTVNILSILTSIKFSSVSLDQIQLLLGWTILTLVCAGVSKKILTINLPKKTGLELHYPTAAKLFQHIEQLYIDANTLNIDNVVISGRHEITLVKEPLFPIPFWSFNKLIIGLPLLQSMSTTSFKCMLTRKLLQYTKSENAITNWIHQLRDLWPRYSEYFSNDNSFAAKILSYFFTPYSIIYQEFTIVAAHMDELNADNKTLHYVNEEDLFQSIEAMVVGKIFLEKKYWPMISRIKTQTPAQKITPYIKLEPVLKNALTTNNTVKWLESIFDNSIDYIAEHPSLKTRMENIGRTKVRILDRLTTTAAQELLEQDYVKIMQKIDDSWQKNNHKNLHKNQRTQQTNSTDRKLLHQSHKPVTVSHHRIKNNIF